MRRLTRIADVRLPGESGRCDLFCDSVNFVNLADADEATTLDGRGLLALPGIVDLGVHAIDKPAFRAGGIVRAALLPDQRPVLDDPGPVKETAASGKPDLWVHPLAAATRGLAGEELTEMALMARVGARGVATGRGWIASSAVMERVMRYAAALNLPVVTHSQDGWLTEGKVATEGAVAFALGLPSSPAIAERMAVERDLALAELTGAHVHFHLLTTRAALARVRAAKAAGLAVTCGTAPPYWLLADHDVMDFRTFARLSPPLRCEDDRLAVREAIADGTVDCLTSAHDPVGPEGKRLPFADAEPGAAGAATLLPLALGLVRDGVVNEVRLTDLLAGAPSRILRLDGGRLEVGAPADLILVDPDSPWQIRGEALGAGGNTPFDGLPVQGRVVAVVKGGTLIVPAT